MDDTDRLTWLQDQLWNGWMLCCDEEDADGAYTLFPPGGFPVTAKSLREVIDKADKAPEVRP
jgi:hypothetical protein